MKKKKKVQNNSSGIVICDSITMSVKRKRVNLRRAEAVAIAVIGYASVIMAFFSMFDLNYIRSAVVIAAIAFSAIYITLSLIGKRAVWLVITSVVAAVAVSFKAIDQLALGYKFIYNAIYRASFHTDISYYKFLKPETEKAAVTAFLILCLWLLAVIIYFFTIYHPNSILPLLATFPIIEVGLYNGMEISVFWGILLVAYWLALFAMTTIDIGEYSGGNGGFVRKEDLFFPKRQMRLKVTEKCGVFIILSVTAVTLITCAAMKIGGYKRSDELNRKRIEVRDAINSFSVENFAESISNITSAFGFTFRYDTHKLGNVDRLKYKDTTDLSVTIDKKYSGAIYLKEYTGSVYDDNKWTLLPDSAYSDPIFADFEMYSIYPQNFPHTFNKVLYSGEDYTIWINSRLKGNRSYSPYGADGIGVLTYNYDSDLSSKKQSGSEFSYKFSGVSAESVASLLGKPSRNSYTADKIADADWRSAVLDYCEARQLLSYDNYFTIDTELPANADNIYGDPELLMAELLQEDYETFVYDNYLQLPDTSEMAEVRSEFAETLYKGQTGELSASDKLELMDELRAEVAGMAEYSLNPGRTPNNRDFVDYFLLENRKGYCTHYATAGVVLARMAGIPARYATGYVIVGDDFSDSNKNPDGSYSIQVKDNRSHAWVELYLNGYGWVPYEFTAGYSDQTIDTTPTTAEATAASDVETTTAAVPAETEAESTSTREAPTGTHSPTTAAPEQTTAASVTDTGRAANGGGFRLHIPDSVKNTALTLFAAALIIGAVLLRRKLILYIRSRRFTEGSCVSRMRYIYRFTEKLLMELGASRDERSYADFAADAERRFGGKYFDTGGFASCTDAALRAAFSENAPESAETEQCRRFAEGFAGKIYEDSGAFKKLYLKYIRAYI